MPKLSVITINFNDKIISLSSANKQLTKSKVLQNEYMN